MKSVEIDPDIYEQFFKNKNAKAIQWETNVAGNIGYPYAKKKIKLWSISHTALQKLIQSGS